MELNSTYETGKDEFSRKVEMLTKVYKSKLKERKYLD